MTLKERKITRMCLACCVLMYALISAYGALPTAYDLREKGFVTAVKDQRPYGTCWAFGTMGAYESSLCRYENLNLDLSENNMINMPSGGHGFEWCSDQWRAVGYLVGWQGPVLEVADAYPNPGQSISRTPFKHVQNVRIIPARTSYQGNDSLKTAIVDVGALAVGYYHDDQYFRKATSSYYNNDSRLSKNHQLDYKDSRWHCVTLVGWDDKYSRSNFQSTPPGDGAFIVKNSWGQGWGDNGYFYVSYYDESFAWASAAIGFPRSEETDNYDDIYQYDLYGATSSYGYGSSSSTKCWGAAMFTARTDSKVAAVGFYALSPKTSYTIYIYTGCTAGKPRSGKKVHSQSGSIEESGYYTIPLSTLPNVGSSQKFSIVLKLNTPKNEFPLAYSEPNTTWFNVPVPSAGQTFYSADGSSWKDFSKSTSCFRSAHFCCKAYVQRTDSFKRLSSISVVGDSVVKGGSHINLSCKAFYSDGSTAMVSPTWLIVGGAESATLSSSGCLTGGAVAADKTVTVMACYSSGSVTKSGLHKVTVSSSISPVVPWSGGWSIPTDIFVLSTYTIDYVLNGGVHGLAHPSSVTYGDAFMVSAPTRLGYTFDGWTVTSGLNASTAKWGSSSSPSTLIGDSSSKCCNGAAGDVWFKNLKSSGCVTLTANWLANGYSVKFDANGGTGTMVSIVMNPTGVYKLPSCTFTPPSGKTRFAGWAGSNGRRYDDEMLVFNLAQPGETVTMTAIWE